jgi:integrase/recombinase XerC
VGSHSARVSYLSDARALAPMRTALSTPDGWADTLDAFDAHMRAAGRPLSTRKMRNYQMRAIAHTLGCAPEDATYDGLLGHLGHDTWGNSYRRAVRSTMRSFYGWMHASGRMPTNPATALPAVQAPRGLPRPASDDALSQSLLRADERTRRMILLAALAGLRCCEIATVHGADVQGPRGARVLTVRGKGDRVREVPITDEVARMVSDAEGYLFPGQIDGHISAAYVSKLISRALPGHTAHTLRHRFATKALRGSGGNLIIVQRLLGHASVATSVYTCVVADELRAAALFAA